MNLNDYKDTNGNVEVSEQLVGDLISNVNVLVSVVSDRSRHYFLNYSGDRPGLTSNLIVLFNSAEIGAHSYSGVWSGQYYIGGNIYKIDNDIGIITLTPASSSDYSSKIFNSGGGWNETSL